MLYSEKLRSARALIVKISPCSLSQDQPWLSLSTKMPKLTVIVDQENVQLDLEEGDDMTSAACVLESRGYDVSPAYPDITLDGKVISNWDKVNFEAKEPYKFSK